MQYQVLSMTTVLFHQVVIISKDIESNTNHMTLLILDLRSQGYSLFLFSYLTNYVSSQESSVMSQWPVCLPKLNVYNSPTCMHWTQKLSRDQLSVKLRACCAHCARSAQLHRAGVNWSFDSVVQSQVFRSVIQFQNINCCSGQGNFILQI